MITDFRVFFSDDNPQLVAFNTLEDIYTKNDQLLFVITPKDGDVFQQDVLAAIEDFTERAWTLPYSSRVDSITNFQHTYAEEDDLIVESLFEYSMDLSDQEIQEKKAIALAEPLLMNRLITSAANVTGLMVTFQTPDENSQAVLEAYSAGETLRNQIEDSYPELDIKMTGMVAMSAAFAQSGIDDAKTLTPLMYGGIILMLFFLLRSFTATGISVLVIIFSILTGLGISMWLGVKMTTPSLSAPTVILTLAVADCVHLFVTMLQNLGKKMSKREAIIESMRLNFMPVLLTSVTTAIGFLMMNFSDAPPFRDLGNITAIGVMLAFALSVTFLPAMSSVLPIKATMSEDNYLNRFMRSLANFVVEKHGAFLVGGIIASLAVLSFIPKNELNDEWVKYFSTKMDFRQDTDYTMKNLTGLYNIQYSLPSGENGGIANPDYLKQVEAFKQWYESQPGVRHVDSMSETFQRLNKNMHGDDPSMYRLPDDRELAAQYLLLYEMSLPLGLDLNNRVDIDKSATQFIATAEEISTVELRKLTDRSEQWLRDNAPDLAATGSGGAVMFAHISERNINSMLKGTLLGVILISLLLVFALKSVKMGVLSLIPNLLPAGLAFGLWGMFVGQVNMAVSVVSSMTLGIVVDDTVHFLSKYLRARREQGLDAANAVRYAFSSVGTALLVTTIILCFGFGILAQSSFALNQQMAQLTCIAIALALVVDFLLLPPILMKLDNKPRGLEKENPEIINSPLNTSLQGA